MVNFQFNLASISGIILAVGGAALYAVRSARPQLARDHDIFFSAVGLLCGLILVFYGWRFDPIMQFGQVMLTGTAVFFVIENLRLRQVSTEQAKKNTPIVDTDRPVSKVYQADFDDYGAFSEREARPRIRANRNRNDDFEDDRPVRRPTARPTEARLNPADRARSSKRRSRDEDSMFDSAGDDLESWESRPSRTRNASPRSESSRSRRRSVEDVNRPDDDTNYVDYRPIEPTDKDDWKD